MVLDLDIHHAAKFLVREVSGLATLLTTHRAADMFYKGNLARQAVWLRIHKAVEAQLVEQPAADVAVL